jgi:hypothetical protein
MASCPDTNKTAAAAGLPSILHAFGGAFLPGSTPHLWVKITGPVSQIL